MGRKVGRKQTLREKKLATKAKEAKEFTEYFHMSPQEFLDNINSLPNHTRTRENIRKARALL
jgi:hypothetical protein